MEELSSVVKILLIYFYFVAMSNTVMHPEGSFTYPFNFSLNNDLPRRGYVRYTCKATIDRPWKFDESIKEPFTVIHHLDCNQLVNALVIIKFI